MSGDLMLIAPDCDDLAGWRHTMRILDFYFRARHMLLGAIKFDFFPFPS